MGHVPVQGFEMLAFWGICHKLYIYLYSDANYIRQEEDKIEAELPQNDWEEPFFVSEREKKLMRWKIVKMKVKLMNQKKMKLTKSKELL